MERRRVARRTWANPSIIFCSLNPLLATAATRGQRVTRLRTPLSAAQVENAYKPIAAATDWLILRLTFAHGCNRDKRPSASQT